MAKNEPFLTRRENPEQARSSAMSSIAPYVALFEAYRNPTMFHRLVFMEYFPDIQPWIQAGRFYYIHSDPNICLVHKLTCLVK